VPVTIYSMDTNEGTTRLWLVPAAGGDPRPLTTAEVSSGQPAFSPDGTRLAFIRKPGGPKPPSGSKKGPRYPDKPQLYVMPVDGGEPERLTDLPLGVADPRWFPDGGRIAFLLPVVTEAPTIEGTEQALKSREEDPVKAAVTEDRVYRYWDRRLTEGLVHHIFAIDVASRDLMDLTPDSTGWFPLMDPADHYRISPDGGEIAFTACRTSPPHDPVLFGVFTAKVPRRIGAGSKAGALSLLTGDHPAATERPVYSPDGRWIVYGMQREYDFYADRVRLVAYDRRSGEHTTLTEEWDRSAMGWSFGDDPRTVFLVAENEARVPLFALDLEKAVRNPSQHPPRRLGSKGQEGWFTNPQPAGGRIFLTDLTGPVMSGLRLGEVEEVTFEGAGGRPVQMFVVHPPSSAAGGKRGSTDKKPLPLVHVIHGGPHGASGDQWHWRWNAQLFAAPGHIVALVNFHGSTGWGQEFAASILGRWGDQPYEDIMAATDALISRGIVDPGRMAATGGSYGGYLASWIASRTDRFACIVNHAGVIDFQTQYGSDVTQGRRRSMGGEPWENTEGMDRYNPMRHASGFKSPMLVIHGELDYRVPYYQGLEIYNVYKAMGLPARLVCYPDENHWILKPQNSRHWYGEVLGWLERWIGKAE
jgi:dipeptidyl aminopeptidase/acylaminoacyl peptidase